MTEVFKDRMPQRNYYITRNYWQLKRKGKTKQWTESIKYEDGKYEETTNTHCVSGQEK